MRAGTHHTRLAAARTDRLVALRAAVSFPPRAVPADIKQRPRTPASGVFVGLPALPFLRKIELRAILAAKLAICGRELGVRRGRDLVVGSIIGEMRASCFSSSHRVWIIFALL